MRTVLAGLATAVTMGCTMNGYDRAGATTSGQEECVTSRDVKEVVVRLRDMGWTAQRTIDAVLSNSHIDDVETRTWFVGLVSEIYGGNTSLGDVEADYAACMKSLAPQAAPVQSASARQEPPAASGPRDDAPG